jgi:hypothetical protein
MSAKLLHTFSYEKTSTPALLTAVNAQRALSFSKLHQNVLRHLNTIGELKAFRLQAAFMR